MDFISVCKNVIGANNKKNWVCPDPAIRVSKSKHGKVTARAHKLGILDKDGNVVATIETTQDGKPIIGCGAKVAILTVYDTKVFK